MMWRCGKEQAGIQCILRFNVIIPAFVWTLWIKSQTSPLGWKFTFSEIGAGSTTQGSVPLHVGSIAILFYYLITYNYFFRKISLDIRI
jgi:hypothetical protein